MGIQKCKNCGTKLKYKDLFKAVFSDNVLHCINCRAFHKIALGSRAILMLLIILPSFITLFPESTKEHIRSTLTLQTGLLVALVYISIIIALSPYIFKYKLKDSKV